VVALFGQHRTRFATWLDVVKSLRLRCIVSLPVGLRPVFFEIKRSRGAAARIEIGAPIRAYADCPVDVE
jgi:hypothetical protein